MMCFYTYITVYKYYYDNFLFSKNDYWLISVYEKCYFLAFLSKEKFIISCYEKNY